MAEAQLEQHAITDLDKKKAKAFFDRGNTVAATGNYEYAIEMYLSGLAIAPDAAEAHQTLRDIALKRKVSGGKSIGFMEAMKLKRPSRDDKQNLLNNAKLLAYDPGETDYMVGVLQNALRGGFFDAVSWIGPILQKANADASKPDVKKFIILRDAYKGLENWKLATEACHYAAMLRPDDMDLQNELKNLGAKETITKGNYGTAATFRGSQKNAAEQEHRLREDSDVRTEDQMAGLIRVAEAEWKADPDDPGKITKYSDILAKTERPELENQAIDLLQAAYDKSRQFRYRAKIGTIRMAQMNRMERTLRANVNANPGNAEVKQEYAQFIQEKLTEELSEFKLAAEAYPTDAKLKFEMAVRLYSLRRFDEVIPVLQQLRQDPKYRVDAANVLGKAFLEAGYVDEAIDTLAQVLADYPAKGDKRSIDMTYVHGRALEMKGELQSAIKAYSQVAQWDFNFKDVQLRIKKLRGQAGGAA